MSVLGTFIVFFFFKKKEKRFFRFLSTECAPTTVFPDSGEQ